MVALKPVSVFGRRLQSVPEPEPFEIHVGALAEHHVGLTVIARRRKNTIVGPLMSVPAESQTKPLLVLHIGDIPIALHPSAPVTVIPSHEYAATITITRKD